MTGYKFKRNLKAYLEGIVDEAVVVEEANTSRALPCVIITVDSETDTNNGMPCHYNLVGQVICAVQGREDDADNSTLLTLGEEVLEALSNTTPLLSAMNHKTPDTRPLSGFRLNGMVVNGGEIIQEDSSSFYSIAYEAFTYCKDS